MQAIYGGSPDASAAGADGAIAAVVAAIVIEPEAGPPGLCSGVLVAQRFVLTAAHCAQGVPPAALRVSFGPDAAPFAIDPCAPSTPSYAAVAIVRDPDADVMLVQLEMAVPLAPVPMAAASPAVGQVGVISGYGLNAQGTAGQRRFAATTVSGRSGVIITVDSGANAGACEGDSGGPLFVLNASGWQVAGVLSEGNADCTGEDQFSDVAVVASWISANLST